VLAYDGDVAGRNAMCNEYQKMSEAGYKVSVAVPPEGKKKQDWNDLHQAGKISSDQMMQYWYFGELLVAPSALEKALLIWNKRQINNFPLDYSERTFWFKLDLDKFNKAVMQIEDSDKAFEMSKEEIHQEAAKRCGGLVEIANCKMDFLYFQRNDLTDESWYYAKVAFPHKGKSIKNTFTGTQISGASEFKKRLISIAPGALFTGKSGQLDRIVKNQTFNIKVVETVDFLGYSKAHKTYLFNDRAVSNGRVIKINDEDYFEVGKTSIKSLNRSLDLHISPSHKYNNAWSRHVWQCFGAKGYAALAFWFGSLFAEQIRAEQESYPFLELVGEPGAGKSTLIEFMWRLFGRSDYEGFDPSKSTAAARSRNLSQVSNLPVVMLEGDRDDENSGGKGMDWDELKTAYNGRATRSRGLKNSSNETYEPPFRGAIVISQNADVSASEAILQRIIHITFTREGHNSDTKFAADELARTSVEAVSFFLLKATKAEANVIDIVKKQQHVYEKQLLALDDIKTVRIAKNHAQIMALVDAMVDLIDMTPEQHRQTIEEIQAMAIARQNAIGADHPMVAQFWETFYYLDEANSKLETLVKQEKLVQEAEKSAKEFKLTPDQKDRARYTPGLNHSKNAQLIALDLNEYVKAGADHKQQIPLMSDLKKLLKASRSHKFSKYTTVMSSITGKSKKCWVFKKPQ